MLFKTLAIILLCTTISYSQFLLDECSETITCILEPYDTQVTIPVPTGSNSEVTSCEGNSLSQMNMMFEASSELMSITVGWDTDDEIKMGVVDACGVDNVCLNSVSCNSVGEMQMNIETSPGRTYIIYIDACNNTIPVDVDVFIDPLGVTELFNEYSGLDIIENCEDDSSYDLCLGTPFRVQLFLENYDYWNSRELQWKVSYGGSSRGEVISNDLDQIYLTIEEPGSYIVCFETVETECMLYYGFQGTCIDGLDIEMINTVESYDVCQHDLDAGWVPSESWEGPEITEAGEYEQETENGCGCEFNQVIIVNEIKEKETEIEVELCPQDYPYDYLGLEEYDYSQQNIEDVLFLNEASYYTDYSGTQCDSVIYLILVNEGPQKRCSSCNLPVSLEKGKIVFCLPFDNATVDVSGQNTIVNPVNIGYDDNGSKENDFWEAILDGDEDYISIPHINNLNTSVFSFNFQFNKDEPFENGDVETIISKGDPSNDNLRFDVSLEKVNQSIFDLKANFYTANGNVEVDMPDLQIFNWYDIACVVETDTISLYLDGFIYSKTPIGENLKGNIDDLYIGTLIDNNVRTQFYNGRLDNFKYWKQKLSGQDVFFLHFPEKEFEVDQSYFLSCCEQAEFRDIIIDINNPLDSVVVPNASPTGYDSVYILNYIQADPGPVLNTSIAPQDIVVQYQQTCQEFCQATASWSTDLSNMFTDNCGNVQVSQSHDFDVVLDENISFVEVTITGTDDCGQSTLHTFGLELECLPSNVIPVPEENAFVLSSNGLCINENEEICIFSNIELQLGYLDETTSQLLAYDNSSEFTATLNINGIESELTSNEVLSGTDLNTLGAGSHLICLERVSNICESVAINYCKTFTIRESVVIDHGDVIVCRDDIATSLPITVSQDLQNLILSNPQQTGISVTEEDECGCENTEKLNLIINDVVEQDLVIELCEGELYEGKTEDEMFTIQSIGNNGCDSLTHINLTFLPKTDEMVFAEICEGESYEGYTEEGSYEEEYINSNGCDSILTIQLSVLPSSYAELFVEICPDSMYMGYNQTGVYELFDTNILGCDSITTLDLTVLDVLDPVCFVSSLENVEEHNFTLFPNPARDRLNILKTNNISIQKSIIFSTDGKLVQLNNTEMSIDVSNLKTGVYILKIITIDQHSSVIRFVKI